MHQQLIIKGSLTDLNKYVNLERSNKFAANALKQRETENIAWLCKEQNLKTMRPPVFLVFHWIAPNKKKDKDNIAYAKKFILDGLQMAQIIPRDSWDNIEGWSDKFSLSKDNSMIMVDIEEC